MYNWISAYFWEIADPARVVPALLVVGVALLWTRWARAGRWIASVGAALVVLVATSPLVGIAVSSLEDRFPKPEALPTDVTGIVLLGGSVNRSLSALRGQPVTNHHADRLFIFAGLAHHFPNARLVFSGAGDEGASIPSETEVSAQVLEAMGVDLARIEFENRATNTAENATFSYELAAPRPGEVWLLVTSAWHMPRAVGSFRQAGWDVIPVPAGYMRGGGSTSWAPTFNPVPGLIALSRASYEWFGLVAYRLLGRTDELFPAPTGDTSGQR